MPRIKFTDGYTIQIETETKVDSSWTNSWAQSGVSFSAFEDTMTRQEAINRGGVGYPATHYLIVNDVSRLAEFKEGGRIVSPNHSGKYLYIYRADNVGYQNHHLEIDCELRDN